MRSSNDWKEIVDTRPPIFNRSKACSNESSIAPNSSLTAIRTAWKIRLAGCPPLRRAGAGIASLIMSTNSSVRVIR